MSARKLKAVPTTPPSAQPAPSWERTERPIDRLNDSLNQAHAIIDVLYVLAHESGDTIDGLRKNSLCESLHSIMRRIEDAQEAAESLELAGARGLRT
jgi:hypothetical protein